MDLWQFRFLWTQGGTIWSCQAMRRKVSARDSQSSWVYVLNELSTFSTNSFLKCQYILTILVLNLRTVGQSDISALTTFSVRNFASCCHTTLDWFVCHQLWWPWSNIYGRFIFTVTAKDSFEKQETLSFPGGLRCPCGGPSFLINEIEKTLKQSLPVLDGMELCVYGQCNIAPYLSCENAQMMSPVCAAYNIFGMNVNHCGVANVTVGCFFGFPNFYGSAIFLLQEAKTFFGI